MAGSKGNQNALGNPGGGAPKAVDRKKSAKLRMLVIDRAIALFEMPRVEMNESDFELYKDIFKKLAGNVLPRLNEHTGEDGGIIRLGFDKAFNDIKPLEDGTTSETETSGPESSAIQNNKSGKKKRKDKSRSGDDVLQSDSLDEEAETEEDDFSDGA